MIIRSLNSDSPWSQYLMNGKRYAFAFSYKYNRTDKNSGVYLGGYDNSNIDSILYDGEYISKVYNNEYVNKKINFNSTKEKLLTEFYYKSSKKHLNKFASIKSLEYLQKIGISIKPNFYDQKCTDLTFINEDSNGNIICGDKKNDDIYVQIVDSKINLDLYSKNSLLVFKKNLPQIFFDSLFKASLKKDLIDVKYFDHKQYDNLFFIISTDDYELFIKFYNKFYKNYLFYADTRYQDRPSKNINFFINLYKKTKLIISDVKNIHNNYGEVVLTYQVPDVMFPYDRNHKHFSSYKQLLQKGYLNSDKLLPQIMSYRDFQNKRFFINDLAFFNILKLKPSILDDIIQIHFYKPKYIELLLTM